MNSKEDLTKVIDKILQDPILLQKLSDKVFQLMLDDLRIQRERLG
jgi:hypothetical protein